MYRLAYICPVIVALAVMSMSGTYSRWWVYALMLLVAELVIRLVVRRVTRVHEYLSGYATNVQHHEAWVERQEHEIEERDSDGEVHRRVEVSYVNHPDEWWMVLNTGRSIRIAEQVYNQCVAWWKTKEHWIDPPHVDCVRGGGGQLYMWNGVYENAYTCTYQGLYVNYLNNSNSIFRKGNISRDEVDMLGLVEYPKIEYLDVDVVLLSSDVARRISINNGVQRCFQLINAFAGERFEIHLFILLFDASRGIDIALKQQEYWRGGNKNEFVVCLGIDPDSLVPGRTLVVEWCKAFSWCDAPRLESATESWFIEHRRLNERAFADWFRHNIHLWKRKEFSDFKYLGVRLSGTRSLMLALVTALFCCAIFYVACLMGQYVDGDVVNARIAEFFKFVWNRTFG